MISRTRTLLVAAALSATSTLHFDGGRGSGLILCDAKKPSVDPKKEVDDKENDWISKFARKGKEALEGGPLNAGDLFEKGGLDSVSAKVHELFASGAPGQIGYGFMMGYSSGFCLKKVSKILAFAVGGIFIAVQTLSYNGYMQVNYDRIQKEMDKVLDLNHDGKVDEKDAQVAYDKVHTVLSYHMPTGGGFSAGLLMGLRS